MGINPSIKSKSQIRILHLVNYFKIGGLEKVLHSLVLGTKPPYFPVVCAIRKTGRLANDVSSHGIPVYCFHSLDTKKCFRTLFTFFKLLLLLRKIKIDIIHCHDFGSWLLGALVGKLFFSKKIICTRHGNFEEINFLIRIQLRILSSLTDKIITVSPSVKENFLSLHTTRNSKVKIIYNGINILQLKNVPSKQNIRNKNHWDNNLFITGTVTRFHKIKNIEMQLEMVDKLRTTIPNYHHFIIAPINEYAKNIIKKAKDKNLLNHITFLGFRDDIAEILNALDVFILTSHSEGTSIALLEAMAAGLPVIASSVGGNKYIINDKKDGFLFSINKLEDLCSIVKFLYSDEDFRKNLSLSATKKSAEFDINNFHKEYMYIYNDLVNS